MDVLDRPSTVDLGASIPQPAQPGASAVPRIDAPPYPRFFSGPLHLPSAIFRYLLEQQGPSLALWRAAEVAALREQAYDPPVLDLGCGDGLVSSMVLPRVELGLDPDPASLWRAARLNLYERFVVAPIEESNIPAGSVGTVVSNSVLEHVERSDDALAAVSRALRPGGRLIFTAPTEAFSRWLTLPSPAFAAWRNRRLTHGNLWSAERWAAHLQRAGLEVEQVRPYLRRPLVTLWDALDLTQQVWIGNYRLAGIFWRRIPSAAMDKLARWGSSLDLSAPAPGGGRLIVARKPQSWLG